MDWYRKCPAYYSYITYAGFNGGGSGGGAPIHWNDLSLISGLALPPPLLPRLRIIVIYCDLVSLYLHIYICAQCMRISRSATLHPNHHHPPSRLTKGALRIFHHRKFRRVNFPPKTTFRSVIYTPFVAHASFYLIRAHRRRAACGFLVFIFHSGDKAKMSPYVHR